MSKHILVVIIIALTCIAILAGAFLVYQPGIAAQMRAWTGEEDTTEQIKGTLSLAWLRLSQPQPNTEPFTPVNYSSVYPYGVNTFFEQEVELTKIEQSMALLADAGITWIRQEFPWEDIEISGKGDFWDHKWDKSAWEKYDLIVDTAEEYGIQIIARLDNPPAWSRTTPNTPEWSKGPPDNYADYADFCHAVASRYAGRIKYYQLWNEPNIYPEWGDQPVDPAAYTELLQLAYTSTKQADPDCVILAAGLAQTTETGGMNMSDLMYLQGMYDAGARGFFDIMGAQAYGLWTGPQDQRISEKNANFQRVVLLREIMVENDDVSTPIWATEVGWNAIPEGHSAAPIYGRVSEEKQAEYAVSAYTIAQEQWPWMGVMNYWFFRRPSEAEMDQAWYYFRMLEPDFTTLPVYVALAEHTKSRPALSAGFYNEETWGLEYSEGWQTVKDSEALFGQSKEGALHESVTFDFTGNRFGLVLSPSSPDTLMTATVDGQQVTLIPANKTGAYTGEHLRTQQQLGAGQHTAIVTIASSQVKLDGVLVFSQNGPHWLKAGIIILLTGMLFVLACVRQRHASKGAK